MADKKLSAKTYIKKRVTYDGFSLAPHKKGKFCATANHGCRTKEGVLMCGLGARYLSIDGVDLAYKAEATPLRMNFVPYQISTGWIDLPLVSTATEIYYYNDRSAEFVVSVSAAGKSQFSNVVKPSGEELTAIVLKGGIWIYGNSEWFKKILSGTFKPVACTYAHRLFAAGGNAKLQYSGAYDYFNFTDSIDEGGYIDLIGGEGEIRQLVPLQEEMYCFFDRQIFRIVGGGAARDFEAQPLPYDGGEIYLGSAAACGDEAVFLSRDGLFRVKDGKISPVLTGNPLRGVRPLADLQAVATEGQYLLPCSVDGVEKTLSIDLTSGECSSVQRSLVACAYHGGVYGMAENGRLFSYETGYPLEGGFVFERNGEPFGDYREKTLKSLCLYGEGEVELSVRGKHAAMRRTVQLSAAGTQVSTRLKGKTFDVKLTLKPGAYLTKLQAETLQAQM